MISATKAPRKNSPLIFLHFTYKFYCILKKLIIFYKSMNKYLMIGIIVLVIVAVGAYLYMNNQTPSAGITDEATNDAMVKKESNETAVEEKSENEAMEKTEDTAITDESTKEFTLNASSFKYDVTEIRVKKGDTVKIILNNTGGIHDWVIDEFDARTKQINDGETDTVTFVASETGEFEYYCSIGNHRAMGMVGTLIVEE
ncbi:hypothetical protein A3A93_01710 [Candidatus Roizmanbacteria bacterium RIFCSPLOWO2_01_FULL_38_12]|uniref:Blue (type 1) copper domain-containing protein n=1 Tax=Candidatus Roizmanbacteria bacterium RIFCSPLOWO2_01_FULL_38_12 TaxID=1802061 RepID=A0A1F7IYE2_9BACT|nr:MAG: hypothetical protein A2861_02290 [Candidatus Roizmanbacteria bacterium RIFCSPHIGHO2_01_FULL_38_15]OGK34506.1 MAG: hypothetical protein A3F59_04235 [Candidatus Roizmanbacteria bacterium RIFCSPHIGHO2_12_FULL_38_13]OGK48335.1 MAG: hypothetical protein A3A93_01710 [Candidatus Roizmanbacteria bacterium RIFCSPLOWO2_01_FULL_38_12]